MPKIGLGHVVFEATHECNLQCLHCYNVWKRGAAAAPQDARYRETKKTLKRLYQRADVGRISMTGGEPLLAERFAELVLFCRLHRSGVTVISNGCHAAGTDYPALIKLGVDLFEFPLNSDQAEIHDRMAGVAGAWEQVTGTVRRTVATGTNVVCVVVLTKMNAHRIAPTLHLIRSLGVRRIMMNRFNLGGSGIGNGAALMLTSDELRAAFGEANNIAEELGLHITANVCTPWCVADPRDFPNIPMTSCGETIARMPLTIDAAGNLRLCNHSPVVLGNIHADELEDILRHSHASRFFETIPTYCASCDLYSRCRGGCKAVSEQIGVRLVDHDPVATTVIR